MRPSTQERRPWLGIPRAIKSSAAPDEGDACVARTTEGRCHLEPACPRRGRSHRPEGTRGTRRLYGRTPATAVLRLSFGQERGKRSAGWGEGRLGTRHSALGTGRYRIRARGGR